MFNSWNSTPLSGAFEEEMKRKTAELLERTASGFTSGQGSGKGGTSEGKPEGKPSQTLLYVAVGVSLLVVVLLLGRKGGKP